MLYSIYWLTQSLADVPERDDWLNSAERACLAKMRFPKRRAEWRLGRWTAKRAMLNVVLAPCGRLSELRLSEFIDPILNNAPQGGGTTNALFSQIEIRAAADGAPEAVMNDKPIPVTLSISHRIEIGFCVINPFGFAVGCDLETVEPKSDHFVADYFTAEEQALVKQAPVADHPWLATLVWSAKESALKALRQGLRLDTRSVVVDVAQGYACRASSLPMEWNRLTVRHTESARTFRGWWRQKDEYIQTLIADLGAKYVENPTQHASTGFCLKRFE